MNFERIIKNYSHDEKICVTKYRASSQFVRGEGWDRVVQIYKKVILDSVGLRDGCMKISYRYMRGILPEIAIDAGLGKIRITRDTCHGLTYRLVSEINRLELRKVHSKLNMTNWFTLSGEHATDN